VTESLLVTVNAQTSIVTPVVAMMTLGTAHALNDLGPSSQPEVTSPEGLGTAAEFFQTARFVATGSPGTYQHHRGECPDHRRLVSGVDRDRAPERRVARVGDWFAEAGGHSFENERAIRLLAPRTLRRRRRARACLRFPHRAASA
jgi:hypothetical protein